MATSECDRLTALKRLSARGIKSGWKPNDYRSWVPPAWKPSLKDLRVEVLRRELFYTDDTVPRCGHWTGSQCIVWLD